MFVCLLLTKPLPKTTLPDLLFVLLCLLGGGCLFGEHLENGHARLARVLVLLLLLLRLLLAKVAKVHPHRVQGRVVASELVILWKWHSVLGIGLFHAGPENGICNDCFSRGGGYQMFVCLFVWVRGFGFVCVLTMFFVFGSSKSLVVVDFGSQSLVVQKPASVIVRARPV